MSDRDKQTERFNMTYSPKEEYMLRVVSNHNARTRSSMVRFLIRQEYNRMMKQRRDDLATKNVIEW